MIQQIIILLVGFIFLVKGADWFVDGAASIAKKMGIPQLIIGLTIVAMGTSMPEAAVSITAAMQQNAGITIGNVVGSNILNIFIILGITALITNVKIQKSTIRYEIPFMILPIFNVLDDLDPNLIHASRDLGASPWQTFTKVIFPLSMNGVRSGVQAVFIPSLSLFMLTRLIGGNRVITLGTAIEQHFLTTQNWGMGSTIGVVLILAMLAVMWLTKERKKS